MRFLSVCSGIEAASAAWNPLGWEAVAFSEIEPFPCAVLAHHYPDVPNYGDMTKFQEWPSHAIDLLCGGTPCQSFSVAGLRKGLDDPRGNLMLTFGAIAAKYRPRWLVWENVPGVLSSNGGRDFGSFLGLLGVLGYGFAYRVLDAQYFGVAQRRRRVFVVGCLGDWRAAAAVLFERHSLSGHPAPRREAGKTSPTIPSRSTAGGGLGTDFDCDGGLIAHSLRGEGFDASEDGTGRDTPLVPVSGVFTCAGCGQAINPAWGWGQWCDYCGHEHRPQPVVGVDGYNGALTGSIAATMGTRGSSETASGPQVMVPVSFAIQAGALRTNPLSGPDGVGVQADHAYTLEARAEVQAVAFDTTQITSKTNRSNPQPGDPCHPLAAGAHAPAIAFSAKDHGADATVDLSPTLRAMGHAESHANGGGQMAVAFHGSQDPDVSGDVTHPVGRNQGRETCVAVAFQERGREDGRSLEVGGDVAYALTAPAGGGRAQERNVLTPSMQVRRLTPTECERLQGFPDGYTAIPWRGKPADQCPDGPRYKALGNSWAVPNVRWIGQRIQQVDQFLKEKAA